MTTEEFKKINSVLRSNYDQYFSKVGNRSGIKQYAGEISWIHADFADGLKMKKGFEDVVGINIMPYRITRTIAEAAVPSDPIAHPFKDQKDGFCDLDLKSGNFHVKRASNDVSIQIVLTVKNTKGLGPGFDTTKRVKDLGFIRTSYYFPWRDSAKDITDEKGLKRQLDSLLKKIVE
ncbi:hypothetical protein SAMN02910370_02197 [Lachnospiraceae bacterium XPB1003]|nr:hypothetical protein SAMN02910370_02197 [Lachnospiraceae bacterium XPB1003]